MIELDELLNGTPTWDQVVEFWRDNGEFCGEEYLVSAIEKHLLTEQQRKQMFDLRLSIEKILNGRCEGTPENVKFTEDLFAAWNQKLGFKEFGY